jgi:hypothetical protein
MIKVENKELAAELVISSSTLKSREEYSDSDRWNS